MVCSMAFSGIIVVRGATEQRTDLSAGLHQQRSVSSMSEAAGVCLPACHPWQWVGHCKSVGSGEKVLIYLDRCLYRGVIREQAILAGQDGLVSFRSTPKPASRESACSPALCSCCGAVMVIVRTRIRLASLAVVVAP